MNSTFEPTGFSLDIFKNRYAFTQDETWNEACLRVAKQMALAELPDKQKRYEEQFNEILRNNLFVPGGRIWYNSGRVNPQLLNCFVLDPKKDSKEGWGNTAKNMIVTSMTGGGCGDDFSDVRPKGATITGQKGECPGPVELMRLVDACAKPVRAGGQRRVALMFSLDLDHPDVEEFLDAKLERGQLTHANVSVRSKRTKDFIKAINKNLDWELSWKGKYKRNIKAQDLWKKIVTNAYNSAEPGFLNWELVQDESNIYYIEDLVTTNPCFTGEMFLKTKDGFKSFKELSGINGLNLINYKGEIVKGKVWSNGKKDIINIRLTNGNIIRCTKDHRFMLIDGTEIEAHKLKGCRIHPFIENNTINTEFTKLGFLQGDGNLTRLNSNTHKGLEVNIGIRDQEIATLFNINYEDGVRSYYVTEFNNILKELQFKAEVLPKRSLPETFYNWNKDQQLSFLKGLYSANGSIIKNQRIAFKTSCFTLVSEISEFLYKIGIENYITTNKSKSVKFENGSYICKESYDLNISRYEGCLLFAKHIGFVHSYKIEALNELIKNKSPMVISINSSDEQEEVFDFNLEDNTHWGVVKREDDIGGYIAHNCGEIALSAFDCCCLGHLVLPRFVEEDGTINYPKLGNTIRIAVRFLDNVLTVNNYPLPEMKDKSHKLRRIGLGTTGLADTLALLGYKYGSEDGNKFIDKLYRFISKAAYEASIMLSIEKGAFPACIPDKHIESGFMKRMPSKIRQLVNEHGIRNCAILTQAPTGTVSILSGNCSSGIEPMFAPAYERRYWVGNERKTELVFHPLFAKFMADGKSVEHFLGSQSLTVRDHMEVQKIIQKHVDNAVSKTINMPEDYPVEDMEKLWLEYLPFLKGTTFYRENTRGYVDDKGVVHEPPLKALTLEEAKSRFDTNAKQEGLEDCATGLCEI